MLKSLRLSGILEILEARNRRAINSKLSYVEYKLAALARPQLLILDHFGLKPLSHLSPEDFYDVISGSYEKGAAIITSNRTFAKWAERFNEPLLASAVLDRLAHDTHQIVARRESYRTRPTWRRSAELRAGSESQR